MYGYEDTTPRDRYDTILDHLDAMYSDLTDEADKLQDQVDMLESKLDQTYEDLQQAQVIQIRWIKLTEQPPVGPGPFLYFPIRCEACLSIGTSNGDYLRGPYLSNREEVYWANIPKPPGYELFEETRSSWEGDQHEN